MQVVRLFGSGDAREIDEQAVFTPHAKSALDWAHRASLILGQKTVEPEHIVLGLVVEGGGAAARILRECDVSPDEVRRRVVRALASQ